MLITFEDRPSDSPFVERVWRSHSERAGVFHSIAASHWNIVVTRLEGRTSLTVRGPETKATMADCPAHGEWFGIHHANAGPALVRFQSDAEAGIGTHRAGGAVPGFRRDYESHSSGSRGGGVPEGGVLGGARRGQTLLICLRFFPCRSRR